MITLVLMRFESSRETLEISTSALWRWF